MRCMSITKITNRLKNYDLKGWKAENLIGIAESAQFITKGPDARKSASTQTDQRH